MIYQIANGSPFQLLDMLRFHIRPKRLKLTYCSLISDFSTYFFKTGTLCLFFLSFHTFSALEFDRNYSVFLLWKMVKLSDRNETKPPIGKIFWIYTPIRHYFVISRKWLLCLFVNKVYDNRSKVTYLQKNKKCCNLETTFQKKVNFFQ